MLEFQITEYTATYGPIIMIVAYALIYLEVKIGIFGNNDCCNFSKLLKKNPTTQGIHEIKLLLQVITKFVTCTVFSHYKKILQGFEKHLKLGNFRQQ